jgi:radical SAM protein with 4Fe4S-binding SPASM domain
MENSPDEDHRPSHTLTETTQIQAANPGPKIEIQCPFLWKDSWISHNGDVAPCCTPSRPNAGNIKENSFRTIWNGKIYQELRKGIREGKPFECCKNCYLYAQRPSSENEDAFIVV